jgi:hypothetical protein
METVVKSEATGDDASVHTEITNTVNDKEVRVESNEPGEIKVEVNNGEVKVESTQASPSVIINDLSKESPTDEGKEEMKKEMVEEMKTIQDKIITFLEDFFSRLQTKLFFWR